MRTRTIFSILSVVFSGISLAVNLTFVNLANPTLLAAAILIGAGMLSNCLLTSYSYTYLKYMSISTTSVALFIIGTQFTYQIIYATLHSIQFNIYQLISYSIIISFSIANIVITSAKVEGDL